ncbi:16S rRNA (cytidine(1402)-2'-O)-methyltransferase [Metamycoplasma auris]|uniref:Ribosomal RNA small subunit methyltransferase I n=1 Tax=Metamycoplasma auris TaxID=51363 RepID=A0A2W7GRJ7_9BACT|nr:16S rRNA (cytidine(1402)-2'-O)-methyltransferase [Metamycoplasma auris]PZV99878.1 16S rRNA (cytidine1402-2'-O)-methyltransferase [Metamycoplasma auris]
MDYKLYVVGTPIGNLEDITLRAIRILSESDIIVCEDIKVSKKLLNHLNIQNKQFISYHKFNERKIASKIIEYILSGKKVSLISDAGMPCISDPGFNLIEEAKENNIFIDVIGGVSAFVNAFIKSNLGSTFSFLGFLKDKSGERINQLKKLTEGVYVAYVSPHKLINTIKDFEIVFGNEIKIYLCKELTKLHEKDYFGNPSQILFDLENENIKGEYVICFLIKKPKHIKINKYENKKYA